MLPGSCLPSTDSTSCSRGHGLSISRALEVCLFAPNASALARRTWREEAAGGQEATTREGQEARDGDSKQEGGKRDGDSKQRTRRSTASNARAARQLCNYTTIQGRAH